STRFQCFENYFSGDISHELILREGTSAQPADGRVETPAPRVISGQHLRRCACARAMHVNADIAPTVIAHHRSHHAADQLRRSDTDRIRQRDGADLETGDFSYRL